MTEFLMKLVKELQVNHDSQCVELERCEYWDKCRQCKLEERLKVYERIISIISLELKALEKEHK